MDKRLNYLYLIAPLFVLLSCCTTMEDLWGAQVSLAAGAILIFAVWGTVWLRLYGMGNSRPEFSILSIIPFAFYLTIKLLTAYSPEAAEPFASPFWQNIYFLTWLAAMGTVIYTFRPGVHDAPKKSFQDPALILLSILTIIYGTTMWSRCTADLFPQLIH